MKSLFDYQKLDSIARDRHQEYQSAKPFPHVVIDAAANDELLNEALESFPTPEQVKWYQYDNALEKKLAMPHLERLPSVFEEILLQFNGPRFILFLEKITGISNLIPDPSYNGGGLHQIPRGGKLDVHADYNYHPKYNLDRRLNVLLYMNKNWEESFGGHFELWDTEMTAAQKRILPIFNRMAIFSTTDVSFHGHPEPLTCPEGWTRKSLALYYYTNGRPEHEKSSPHSTIFKRRPQDPIDQEIEALREKRAKRRLEDKTTGT